MKYDDFFQIKVSRAMFLSRSGVVFLSRCNRSKFACLLPIALFYESESYHRSSNVNLCLITVVRLIRFSNLDSEGSAPLKALLGLFHILKTAFHFSRKFPEFHIHRIVVGIIRNRRQALDRRQAPGSRTRNMN